ncbi:MAG: UDP-N-acetylmuramoyl-tripeptide--D-alanyl-D-alanine ligase [Chitinophagales bacterium]|nr:UDP-N-acetylmuramoyl-tripeptide--D-alanyl-D-alanine ligase [Chitinophagales bacterium]
MQIENLYQLYLSSTGVTTDTRNIAPGNIFFALKGERFNANEFAAQALEAGASHAVIDELKNADWQRQFGNRLIMVEDVLTTLQQLAGYHRHLQKCTVLAITGSNGKTTTKELVAAVLSKKYKTYATKGNLNNHIGIPLTLLSIRNDVEFAVIEMGANHQGEIASYCEYVMPDYGLITNVGLAHIEGFGGFEGVVKGKTELYKHLMAFDDFIFMNADNTVLMERMKTLSSSASGWNPKEKLITYGTHTSNFCFGNIAGEGDFLSIETEGLRIQTNLIGSYNFENVLAAVCIGKYFDVPAVEIKSAIENYVPSNNRSQKVTWNGNTIILDAYNANPSSMQEALKNFEQLNAAKKIVVLGEMMELGEYSAAEHQKIKNLTDAMQLNTRIFTGNGFSFLKNDSSVLYFENTAQLKEWFCKQPFQNTCILIKGSRKNELEKLLQE